MILHGRVWSRIISNKTCELQPAGELQGIMLKIYCERFWLILEDVEIIVFENNDMLCSGAFCKCNDAYVTHVILILHS